MESHGDEVVHGLDVVRLELIPCRPQRVALLRREAALVSQVLDAGLDVGPQALHLGGRRHKRARIAGERRFQCIGVEQRHALHAALFAHESARDFGAAHRALLEQPTHVIDQGQPNRFRLEHPQKLRLLDHFFFVALALQQSHFEFDLGGCFRDRYDRLGTSFEDRLLFREISRIFEERIGQIGGPHFQDLPIDLGPHQLLQAPVHRGEIRPRRRD
jgi:hypothetical protein